MRTRASQLRRPKKKDRQLNTETPISQPSLPKLDDEVPVNSDRQILKILDNNSLIQRACPGFRLFVRTFSDQQLLNCHKNPSLNTVKSVVQPHLRHIHVLRNAWRTLSEHEREAWQLRYDLLLKAGNISGTIIELGTLDEPLEEYSNQIGSKGKRREQNEWLSTLSYEKLPCPLCDMGNSKRFDLNGIIAHLTLSHPSVQLYACHICHTAFTQKLALEEHVEQCEEYGEFLSEHQRIGGHIVFDFAYASIICAGCGVQVLLSTRAPSEELAAELLNLMLAHSNEKLVLCMVYASMELESGKIQIQFMHPTLLDKLMGSKESEWNDGTALGRMIEDDSKDSSIMFGDHQLAQHSKVGQQFLTNLFLARAPQMPAALDKSATVIIGPIGPSKGGSEGNSQCTEAVNTVNAKKRKTVQENRNTSAKEDCEWSIERQPKMDKAGGSGKGERTTTTSGGHSLTYAEWTGRIRQLERNALSPGSSLAKFVFTLELEAVYSGRLIVQNPLDGKLLNDNVYQCTKCFTVVIGDRRRHLHFGKCFPKERIVESDKEKKVEEDLLAGKFHRFFHAETSFPFEPVACALCPSTSFCSIPALQLHFAREHNRIFTVQSNKSTIEQCAAGLLKKDWLNTDFDRELQRLIDSNKHSKRDNTSELSQEYLASTSSLSESSIQQTNLECKEEPDDHSYGFIQTPIKKGSKLVVEQQWPILKQELVDSEDLSAICSSNSFFESNSEFKTPDDRSNIEAPPIGRNGTKEKEPRQCSTSLAVEVKVKKNPAPPRPCKKQVKPVSDKDQSYLSAINLTRVGNKSHYICFMCTFPERPCSTAFGLHLTSHPETELWRLCPICLSKNKRKRGGEEDVALEQFHHPLQFFKHVEKSHMRIQRDLIGCPYCDHSIPTESPEPDPKAIAAVFRHMFYECNATDLCLLCGYLFDSVVSSSEAKEGQGLVQKPSRSSIVEHRWKRHRLIFDRFVCSSCKCGFYSREQFIKHRCELAIRCNCNPSIRFRSRAEFAMHLQKNVNVKQKKAHNLMESKLERDVTKRRYLQNDEYQRKVMDRIKQEEETELEKKTLDLVEEIKKMANSGSKNKRTNGKEAAERLLQRPQKGLMRGPIKEHPTKRTKCNGGRKSAGQKQKLLETGPKKKRIAKTVRPLCDEKRVDDSSEEEGEEDEEEQNEATPPPIHSPGLELLEDEEAEMRAGENGVERTVGRLLDRLVGQVVELVDGKAANGRKRKSSSALFEQHSSGKKRPKVVLNCDKCLLIFHTRASLEQHREWAHTHIKYFPLPLLFSTKLCRFCCIAFPLDSSFYVDHMKRKHPTNTAACQFCSGIQNECDCVEHKTQHPENFICSMCLLRFTNETKLAQHLDKVHKKTLAYFCKNCGFCNTSLYSVLEHMFIKGEEQCSVMEHQVIFYVGTCIAAQLRLLPDHSKWVDEQIMAGKFSKMAESAECKHQYCLQACNEPALITCNDCLCPIPFSAWNNNFYQSNHKFPYEEQCKLIEEGKGAESIGATLYQMLSAEMEAFKMLIQLRPNIGLIQERLRQLIFGDRNKMFISIKSPMAPIPVPDIKSPMAAPMPASIKSPPMSPLTYGRVLFDRQSNAATPAASWQRQRLPIFANASPPTPRQQIPIFMPRFNRPSPTNAQQQQSSPIQFVQQRPTHSTIHGQPIQSSPSQLPVSPSPTASNSPAATASIANGSPAPTTTTTMEKNEGGGGGAGAGEMPNLTSTDERQLEKVLTFPRVNPKSNSIRPMQPYSPPPKLTAIRATLPVQPRSGRIAPPTIQIIRTSSPIRQYGSWQHLTRQPLTSQPARMLAPFHRTHTLRLPHPAPYFAPRTPPMPTQFRPISRMPVLEQIANQMFTSKPARLN